MRSNVLRISMVCLTAPKNELSILFKRDTNNVSIHLKTLPNFPDYCSRATRLTNSEISRKRNAVFSEEKARQMALITRIEKVQVVHQGPPEDCTLLMNKHMSTPFNVAMREYTTIYTTPPRGHNPTTTKYGNTMSCLCCITFVLPLLFS